MPNQIVPTCDGHAICDNHGNNFNPDDQKLVLVSENITIYTESCDKILPIPSYARPTVEGCKCLAQADTHDHLLDYLYLHNHLHRTVTSGNAMNASFNARKTALSSIGLKSSLSYPIFLRACTGFAQMIRFRKEDFLCSSCGDSLPYIVCDGKAEGPSKRKVSHLEELDRFEGDVSVLCQGSLFKDRVFLPENCERKLICHLLTKSISVDEFLESEEVRSHNGLLVKAIVERVSQSWPEDDLPKPYHRLVGNVSKYSSVAGFLQVTEPRPLELLEMF